MSPAPRDQYDDWATHMAEEILNHPPMELLLKPETVMTMIGVLQLATRHPNLPPNTRRFVEEFIDHARAYFAECPFVLQVIRMGDDPEYDQ